MSSPPGPGSHPRPHRWHSTIPAPARLFAIGIGALLLIGGLFLLARNAPSATVNNPTVLPTPVLAADDGCANFARFWASQSALAVDPDAIAAIGNCRLAADGSWFVPIGADDPRLPVGDHLTDAERAATATLRTQLETQRDLFTEEMPPSLEYLLRRLYDPSANPVTGHLKEGVTIGPVRAEYQRFAQAALLDPGLRQLADYAGWWMARRMAAYEAFAQACIQTSDRHYLDFACEGMLGALSVRFPPWPWDLNDSVALQEYLVSVVRATPAP